MNDLEPLDAYCAGLIANLTPAARRQLAREMASRLRASQAKRIAAQQNPDGSTYAPRKPHKFRSKKGLIRRTMFAKMRTARFLKSEATPEGAAVTFASQVQRIAQVHQYGLRDKVNRRRGPEVQYSARELLGLTANDLSLIEDMIIARLAR